MLLVLGHSDSLGRNYNFFFYKRVSTYLRSKPTQGRKSIKDEKLCTSDEKRMKKKYR